LGWYCGFDYTVTHAVFKVYVVPLIL
jgi:hypothetical protein